MRYGPRHGPPSSWSPDTVGDRQSFAYETVFSYWKALPAGGHASKADDIRQMQVAGYRVFLIFVGLAKLIARFPRTQAAIRHAAPIADITAMFDNSRTPAEAFSLVRVQKKNKVLFDARDPRYRVDPQLQKVAAVWLDKVARERSPAGIPQIQRALT